MRINITELWNGLKQVFTPERSAAPEPAQVTPTDSKIIEIPKFKRSPGHTNIAELAEEPEWYHD